LDYFEGINYTTSDHETCGDGVRAVFGDCLALNVIRLVTLAGAVLYAPTKKLMSWKLAAAAILLSKVSAHFDYLHVGRILPPILSLSP
jgi:hypothetical protein